jgi:hypothetical protein
MLYYLCRGILPQKISALHAKYGEVVRVAPNELSFVCEEAWERIYGRVDNGVNGKGQLGKDPSMFSYLLVVRLGRKRRRK